MINVKNYFRLDKGNAQTVAPFSQCNLRIFFWKPSSVGVNFKTVQYKG